MPEELKLLLQAVAGGSCSDVWPKLWTLLDDCFFDEADHLRKTIIGECARLQCLRREIPPDAATVKMPPIVAAPWF